MKPELVWALGLFGGVVVTAALINRFAPAERARLRRLVILFVVYVVALGASLGLAEIGAVTWSNRFGLVAELLQAFTVVNIAATLGLSVIVPALGLAMPMIASDLLVGLGYIVTTLGVVSGHGLDPSSVLATSAVVSAVLAISLQSTLGNVLGGVALQLDGSIHEGDWIQFDNGRQGRVRSIRWRHTVVETRDWSTIIVPNAQLLATNITILGKRNGEAAPQRMWMYFNVDFRFAPTKVTQIVTDALTGAPIDGLADKPAPDCVCMDFAKEPGQSFITYGVRYWLPDMMRTDSTASLVRARVYAALRRADIPLALPANAMFVQLEDEQRTSRKAKQRENERMVALRTVHLFRNLTEAELETLSEGMNHVIYANGEKITRQGAVAHWLYIMTSGTAEIRMKVDPDGPNGPLPEKTKVVASLKAPDFFGEMGLMTGESRTADVVAIGDVECFRLGKETFERVLLKRPEIATELSEKLATRRVELLAVRDGLDESQQKARQASERERILLGIKEFFGL
ncbi:mechanosensitive ion channel family protein [Labilithrix luteola]|uniref:mechanosensitive ion channel family protein n=1 Tax=Labilithrix luteola TaxID=1391654 RepID=UPI000AFF73CE|nr:mechanosensitive ion channel family protein [Labilithrix luteola]